MNILHLAETPLSASPYNLMMVQRKGGHNARLISHKNRYSDNSPVFFPSDILLRYKSNSGPLPTPDFDADEVHDLFRNADIIHCHNYLDSQFVFRFFPHLRTLIKKKYVVVQFHSPRASIPAVEKILKTANKTLVVAQYQTRQFPESIPVPNAFDIDDDLHKCVEKSNPPTIVYSPSNTRLKGWNNKGFNEVSKVLDKITGNHRTNIITGIPYVQCLKAKQTGDIAIDEVMTGSYHLCSLEAMSHGQVAISGMDANCFSALKLYTQTEWCPMISTKINELQNIIQMLVNEPEMLKQKQLKSREFMEKYWSIERLNDYFKKVYND